MYDIFVKNKQKQRGNTMYNYPRIKDLREDADLKQKDIADLLEITQQQYSLYENGKREILLHHFITLAKFYNVSLDYLAGLIPTPRLLDESKQYKVAHVFKCTPKDVIDNIIKKSSK